VIARVRALGKNQPKLLTFADRHGRLIGDAEVPGVSDDFGFAEDVEFPGVVPVISPEIEIPGVDDGEGQEDPAPQEIEIADLEIESDPAPIEVETVQEETAEVAPAIEPMQLPGPRRSGRVKTQTKPGHLPSMTGSKHSHAVTQLKKQGVLHPDAHTFSQDDFCQSDPDVVAVVMTQLSLKTGLKAWGEKANDAAFNEMKQLHFRSAFKPWHWRDLSHAQRQMVPESRAFLKEKRDGKTKARTVAGGNKQRGCIRKEDASLPAVAAESVLLTCIVDAEEGRDVAVIGTPSAFVQTRMEDENDVAFIKIRGVLVDILVEIAPDVCKDCVAKDKKGVKQLLVQRQSALCGTMVASPLCCRKFAKSLTDTDFVINPCDPCVANKIISGKQVAVCWHVDCLSPSGPGRTPAPLSPS